MFLSLRPFQLTSSLTAGLIISQNFKQHSCSINADNNIVHEQIHNGNCSTNNEGSAMGKSESSSQKGSFASKEVLKKLRRYGISGVLSYGLLNTAYYLTTFLFVWFYVAPVPGRMGYMAAVESCIYVVYLGGPCSCPICRLRHSRELIPGQSGVLNSPEKSIAE